MLIKCFKKLSFRNSPFSSPSPHPVSWRPRAPHFARTSHLRQTFASLVALSSSRYQSPVRRDLPGVPAGWGLSRARSSLGRTVSSHVSEVRAAPGVGWERSRVWDVQSPSRLLRLHLVCHLEHRWLPSHGANKGTDTLPYLKKKKQRKESARWRLSFGRACLL